MIATAITSRKQTVFYDRESLQQWKVTMRTSNTRGRKFNSTVVKILMALVLASMIGGISIAPAFARYRHGGYRVYAPPVVVYAPDEYVSPGIDLAFPIEIGGDGGDYYCGGGHRGGGSSFCRQN
jgi:hypothetical protein